MPNILKILEWRERTFHETVDGGEIWNTYYVEPYCAHPMVTSVLIGSIDRTVNPPQRILPAYDPYYPHYYCTDVRVDQVSPEAMSGSPATGYSPQVWMGANADQCLSAIKSVLTSSPKAIAQNRVPMPAGPNWYSQLGIQDPNGNPLNRPRPDRVEYEAGCFVTGVFKPLVSAYIQDSQNPSEDDRSLQFDAVDPIFEPYAHALAIQKSLKIIVPVWGWYKSTETAAQKVETFQHFSIRRIMCPRVPYEAISRLANRVNPEAYRIRLDDGGVPTLHDLPMVDGNRRFPKETLKFECADVTKRVVSSCYAGRGHLRTKTVTFPRIDGVMAPMEIPDAQPETWYDITLHFNWRTHWDWMVETGGLPTKHEGWVGWNHMFCEPGRIVPPGGMFAAAPALYHPANYYRVGWRDWTEADPIGGGVYRPPYRATNAPWTFDELFKW